MTSQSMLGMFGGPVYDSHKDESEEEEEEKNEVNSNRVEEKIRFDTKREIQKRELISSAKMPLNSLCKCGSKKKYKNCCIKEDSKDK